MPISSQIEKYDKTNDLKHIENKLQHLKSSIEQVKQEEQNFDKQKDILSDEVFKQKQEVLQQKKNEIEQEKQETKQLIDQLQKEVQQQKEEFGNQIDQKLSDLDNEVTQEINKNLWVYEQKLSSYEKELDNLSSSSGFLDKIKNTGEKVWNYVKENPGKSLLIGSGIGLAIWWIKKLFKRNKKEKVDGDKEKTEKKKPWYKRWISWIWIGVAWFLWFKYFGDIKNLFNRLFGWEKEKKDAYWKEIATALGDGWSYDEAWNNFIYKSKKYPWDTFYKENLIYTYMDSNGKMVLDVDKTVEAIKKYVEETVVLPDQHSTVDLEKYRNDWEKLDQKEKEKYFGVQDQVEWFYAGLHNETIKLSSEDYWFDKWYFLYHMDQTFDNIGTMLDEQMFSFIIDSSTESLIESIFKYFPDFMIAAFKKAAVGINIVWLDEVAEGTSKIGDYLKSMKPTEITKLEKLSRYFYENSLSICYYATSVRNTYFEKVWWDEEKMEAFNKKRLKDLDKNSISDQELVNSIDEPEVDSDVVASLEKLDKRQNKLIEKLDEATTPEQQKKIIEKLIDEIDDVWYKTWSSAFALVRWHLWETNNYIQYDIVSQMYEWYFADIRWSLKGLLEKNPLTESDILQLKNNITDFYSTLKSISTQIEFRQETDEDGNLFTVMNFPVVSGGKTIFQTFMLHMQEWEWVLAWWTVATWLLVWDLLTWPARKILALRKLFLFKKPIVRLSPTDWVIRKLTKWTLWLLWAWVQKWIDAAVEAPSRIMSQSLNSRRFFRSMTFKNPEVLFEALQKWHIKLEDAATMLAGKSAGKTFSGLKISRLWEKWRVLGFEKNVEKNMIKLLENNTWVKNNIWAYSDLTKDKYKLLMEHWDTKKVRLARKKLYSGKMVDLLFDDLSKWNLSTKIEKGISQLDKEKLTSEILESNKNVEKVTKEAFEKFEKELAKEAKKLWLKSWTKEYKALSETLWSKYEPDLQKILVNHNKLVMKHEEKLMKYFNKASWSEKQFLYASDDTIKKIINANWWLEKWRIPAFGRTWRLISVGVHAVMLWWMWSSKDEHGNKKGLWTLWWEAADFGLWMIPVAGWLYDIGMAFRGKDLNGRKMWTGERWIRWVVWLWTGILDVFSFGLGWTAIRASIKGWTKVAIKAGEKVAIKAGEKAAIKAGEKALVKESIEIASKWVWKWTAKQIFKWSIRNIIVGTAAWLVLVPVVWWLREVVFDADDTPSDYNVAVDDIDLD